MDQKPRAFDVAEEANAEAGAFMRTLDESGEISDDKGTAELCAVAAGTAIGIDDPEIGLQRGERVVGDFRSRRGNHGNQCRFARIGKTDEPDVSE